MSERSFRPGTVWNDAAGKPIHAHGGSVIEVDGIYFWYGDVDAARSLRGRDLGVEVRLAPFPFDGDVPTLEWRDEWSTDEFE